jgi:RND family efflux transporter MFP subunit
MANDVVAALSSLKLDPARRERRRGRGLVAIGGVLLAVSCAVVVILKPYVDAALFAPVVSVTQVVVISPNQDAVELSAQGYIRPERFITVAPRTQGVIHAVHVRQGQHVHENDVLFELDSVEQRANVKTAVSDIAVSSAAAESAHARTAVAQSELEEAIARANRERRLAEQGLTPPASAEDLEGRVVSLKQRVAAADAEAKAASAQALAQGARAQALAVTLTSMTIRSPMEGTVISRPPDVGEYLQAPFTVGVRIADLSALVVETDVPEGRLSLIKGGGPVEITLDAYPEKRFRGQVKETLPEVDRSKATVVVRVSFLDPLDGVLPDMSARVSFLTEKPKEETEHLPDKKVIPAKAIAEREGRKVVFVVEGEKVRMMKIKLGPKQGDGFELLEGPLPGAQLVISPPETLADGQRVKKNAAQ